MAWQSSAVAAAELRVVQSRRDLCGSWRRLRARLSRPSFLAAAAGVGALLGLSLRRGGPTDALAGTLAAALTRHVVEHLIRDHTAAGRARNPVSKISPGTGLLNK
jgi:hypothetical protein